MIEKNMPPNANLYYHANLNAVRIEWLKLAVKMDQFHAIVNEMINFIQYNTPDNLIVDQYNSTHSFSKEIQHFIDTQLQGAVQALGIKNILTVVPKERGLSSLSVSHWQRNVKRESNFNMVNFETLAECTAWIENNTA